MDHPPRRRHVPSRLLGPLALALLALPAGRASAGGGEVPGGGGAVPRAPREIARIELGRRLFFDPRVSRSGEASCASCHDPEHGFSDPGRISDDDFSLTPRHSQTLLDAADNPSAHWDGEFRTIEDLVTARLGVPTGEGGYGGARRPPPLPPTDPEPPPGTPREDGRPLTPRDEAPFEVSGARRARPEKPERPLDVRALPAVADVLERGGRYAEAFAAAFGTPSVTTDRLADAIAAYVRTIRSTESPLDRFLAGEEEALSLSQRRGFDLFLGRAGCAACHKVEGKHPAFTDYAFHDTGVSWKSVVPHVETAAPQEAVFAMDPGRERISTARDGRRAFKTPTLRDVTRRGPYMHDGSLETLEDVVRHYAAGGSADPEQDRQVKPLALSEDDARDLVAFLHALEGEVRPGLAPVLWARRAEETRVRFLDGRGAPLAGLAVDVLPAGDVLPGDLRGVTAPLRLQTDDRGWIAFAPRFRTHARLFVPGGLPLEGGDLVPDTCRKVEVTLPVRGRARVAIAFPSGTHAPETLVAEHVTGMALPEARRPRSLLARVALVEVEGAPVARYETWVRTDVPSDVRVRLPGDEGRYAPVVRLRAGEEVRLELE